MVNRVLCDKSFLEFKQKLWRINALNRVEDTHNNVNNRIEHGHLGDAITLEKGLLDLNADYAKRPRYHISAEASNKKIYYIRSSFSCLMKKTCKNKNFYF